MVCLRKEQLDVLVGHSEKEYPNEACGILAGKDGKVKKIYQMTNRDKSSESFFMEPTEQLKVMKEIRASRMDFIGIYHSHPETDAYPSAHDVELAYYPKVSYLIVSLKERKDPKLRSFKIVEGRIEEEVISINP